MGANTMRSWIRSPDGRTFSGRWPQDMPATGEGPYIAALARQVRGACEVVLPVGRADVATDLIVYEVEPVRSWREGARQALAYAGMSGLSPALALFGVADYLPIYLRMRDRLPALTLWRWDGFRWERVTSRQSAIRKVRDGHPCIPRAAF